MNKITQVTVWKVEGFSGTFNTKEEAEQAAVTRDLADNIEKMSDLSEDDAWNLASQLKAEFCMIPRSKTPDDLLTEFVERTQLYMNPETKLLLENLKNAY
jgi:hypothetical protein